jgi:predicted RNase H-like nuclease (RuvC/YqgF family)
MPTWLAYVGLFSLIISLIGIGFNVWSAFRKERREDGQTEMQRIKKVEAKIMEHDNLHTGQVQARERMAEDFRRDYNALKEALERRCADLEQKAHEVPQLRERIASMEAKLDRIPEMDRKLDRLHEMLGAMAAK